MSTPSDSSSWNELFLSARWVLHCLGEIRLQWWMTTRFVIITVSASVTWFVVWASTWVNIGRAGKERRFEWLCILYCHTGVAYVCSLYLVPCTLYQSLLPGTWHGLISRERAKRGDLSGSAYCTVTLVQYMYLPCTLYLIPFPQYLVPCTKTC